MPRGSCRCTAPTLTRSSPRADNDAAQGPGERERSVNLPIGLTLTRIVAVPGLRAVSAGHGVVVPASRLAKWKAVSQYVAVTMLILEKGMVSSIFHRAAVGMLWVAVALTIVSAVDYFYRFFRKADYRAIVPEEERWS